MSTTSSSHSSAGETSLRAGDEAMGRYGSDQAGGGKKECSRELHGYKITGTNVKNVGDIKTAMEGSRKKKNECTAIRVKRIDR